MIVPDLISTPYLLTVVAWPIIKNVSNRGSSLQRSEVTWQIVKQNVANIGNRLQCFEVTSDALG